MPELRDVPLDSPDAQRLLAEFEAEIAALYPGWSPTTGPSAKPQEFIPPSGLFVVASDGVDCVACGGYKRLSPTDAEIKRMFVTPDARGKGFGALVLAELESRARSCGYVRVRLDTGAAQPAALRLYQTRGYDEIDDYNGNQHASHWLEKVL